MSNVLIGDLEGVQNTGGKGCLLKASSLWLSGSLHFDFKLAQVFRGIRLGAYCQRRSTSTAESSVRITQSQMIRAEPLLRKWISTSGLFDHTVTL